MSESVLGRDPVSLREVSYEMVMSVEGEERLMDDYRAMEREKQLEMLWETVMKISPLALTVSRMRDSIRQAQTRIKLVEKRLYQQVTWGRPAGSIVMMLFL